MGHKGGLHGILKALVGFLAGLNMEVKTAKRISV
jgi:hypothetical protein